MSIKTSSYIKDKDNLKWLEENENLFIDYMSKHHSLYDCFHTFLHIDTLNDAYVSRMRLEVEKWAKRKALEEEAAVQQANTKMKTSKKKEIKSATEKKIDEAKSTADDIRKRIEEPEESDLLD